MRTLINKTKIGAKENGRLSNWVVELKRKHRSDVFDMYGDVKLGLFCLELRFVSIFCVVAMSAKYLAKLWLHLWCCVYI